MLGKGVFWVEVTGKGKALPGHAMKEYGVVEA
jgi:hypothetical protein